MKLVGGSIHSEFNRQKIAVEVEGANAVGKSKVVTSCVNRCEYRLKVVQEIIEAGGLILRRALTI